MATQNVVTITTTKFPDAEMKTVIGIIILKTVLFTLLHNMFSLMPINNHDMNKRAAEMTLHLYI
jgi:hypothetical protein